MEKISLKKIVTHGNKSTIYLLMTGIFLALYLGSGAISYQIGIVLPIFSLEMNIPLMTWTIWIYSGLYPLYIVWCLYSYKNEEYMNKTFYGFILLTIISCLIFVMLPVIYPREMFPLPFSDDISTMIFKAMRAVDKPSNCFPSLHVGLCYFFCFGFRFEDRKKYWIAFAISTLVAISTLTTKQHYSYDLIAGFVIAFGIHSLLEKVIEIKD